MALTPLTLPEVPAPARRARSRAASALSLSASARKRSSSFRRQSGFEAFPFAAAAVCGTPSPGLSVREDDDGRDVGIFCCRFVVSGSGGSAGSRGLRPIVHEGGGGGVMRANTSKQSHHIPLEVNSFHIFRLDLRQVRDNEWLESSVLPTYFGRIY